MATSALENLFEHNNWANAQIMQACLTLGDEQLDATPKSATMGTVRETLSHLVKSQRGYLRLLTLPVEQRQASSWSPAFTELPSALDETGEALLALVRDEPQLQKAGRVETTDGYLVEPWVVLLQIINHATEHREQIKSMLTALGITPPSIDGWDYGEAVKASARKAEQG